MSSLQNQVAEVNKVSTDFAKREKAIKAIFDMVYGWGRWNVVANEDAPAFREAIKELLKI